MKIEGLIFLMFFGVGKNTQKNKKNGRKGKKEHGPAECGRRWGGFGRGQEQENPGKRQGQEQKARNFENDEILANLRPI